MAFRDEARHPPLSEATLLKIILLYRLSVNPTTTILLLEHCAALLLKSCDRHLP